MTVSQGKSVSGLDQSFETGRWQSANFETEGLSDSGLLNLMNQSRPRRDGRNPLALPWLFWTSEIYSLGHLIRRYSHIPDMLPIPAYSDHGVTFGRNPEHHEIHNSARIHLTWSPWRKRALSPYKKTLLITHPWSLFREEINFKHAHSKRLLFFLPHSVPSHGTPFHSLSAYQGMLKSFDRRGLAPSVMLHPHDITSGYFKEIRRLGYPIYSAGHTESARFVYRFYDILKHFSMVLSPTLGSHIFLAQDAGVPSVISGPVPRQPDSVVRLDRRSNPVNALQACLKAFTGEDSLTNPSRVELTARVLGRSNPECATTMSSLKDILWHEMSHLAPMYAHEYAQKFSRRLGFTTS